MTTKIKYSSRHLSAIKAGEIEAKWSANYSRILRYSIDMWQKDLELHKQVSAPELYLLEIKVGELVARWDRMADDHIRKSKLAASKEACDALTIEASGKLDGIRSILSKTLRHDDRVDWEKLKNRTPFRKPSPFPEKSPKRATEAKPIKFDPPIGLLDKVFRKAKVKRAKAEELFQADVKRWDEEDARNAAAFVTAVGLWEARKLEFEKAYHDEKATYLHRQATENAKVDELSDGVRAGDPKSVIEHASLVLDASDYDGLFEKSYELDYQPAPAKVLLIEYDLPSPEIMPTLKALRFMPSTGEVKETHISDKEQKANYDSACYQVCLRTFHELFEADECGNYDAILFNGFSTAVNKSTGRDVRSCIMSAIVTKADFEAIDLGRVDPKACFKSLKGVSASSLAALAPIAPLMEMNKEDKRFIDAREVVASLDAATNLAAMDWGDFEHLIRELFEKEFASRGGDVKITQASSDGGVDAVAFDPDPITGGKIVIQAKRYTRTVGVSAVRDLYGTVQHEGASRGILISTADYGPDAHQFASGKPLSLFSGSICFICCRNTATTPKLILLRLERI
ncbi:restriction endonuclease [Pararhizobium gei]|uniref:restriction endonuclease n=1 Tax=Pararhizobium gei TaxID=1395951 RepID=UPI0023D9C93E|nr:restriction endonuclease [Rhizobium gei]